ncbi:6-phosphogluconolactonase [Rubidibacter lacunae KORDI 51-2]|uniref:6-phosphogluconolactonase n=1 Tax=Rubidibacter lacunae KORDI 51-2 TaxID=582515 RepID=U5D7V4_9CHRO|nr:6-phosphogluconolactonase [Rubidibacter lacunae]ERN40698.1 6-phosphogluconolactonase [Rubidibacter lacunae KORDI 51-2]
MQNRKLEVLPDKVALVARARAFCVETIRSAIAERDRCTIALSGGSTPRPLYEQLAAESLPWDRLHVFWGDERYVSPDHPESNQRMAREAWLDKVPIPAENLHPMPTADGDAAVDAEHADGVIRSFFQLADGEFPEFDLILLGMGDDGHTASLFPHTNSLQVCDRSVTVGNKGDSLRLTFSVPVLNCARRVLFLISGANKRPALKQVLASEGDNAAYPSRLVQPAGELWWLLDADAGADLVA